MPKTLDPNDVEARIGHRFLDRGLLVDACDRSSRRFRLLEFHGDSILNLGAMLCALHSGRGEAIAKSVVANGSLRARVRELFPAVTGTEVEDFVETVTSAVALDTDCLRAMDVATNLLGMGTSSMLIALPQPPDDRHLFPVGGAVTLGREVTRFAVTDHLVRVRFVGETRVGRIARTRSVLLSRRHLDTVLHHRLPEVRGRRRRRRTFHESVTETLRSDGLVRACELVERWVIATGTSNRMA